MLPILSCLLDSAELRNGSAPTIIRSIYTHIVDHGRLLQGMLACLLACARCSVSSEGPKWPNVLYRSGTFFFSSFWYGSNNNKFALWGNEGMPANKLKSISRPVPVGSDASIT